MGPLIGVNFEMLGESVDPRGGYGAALWTLRVGRAAIAAS